MKSVYDIISDALSDYKPGVVCFPSVSVSSFISILISAIGTTHEDVLQQNTQAFYNILPSESVITVEKGDLIASNVCFAFCALILDYESITKIFTDALSLEFDLDLLSGSDRKDVRGRLRNNSKSGLHFMEYGVTTFTYDVWSKFFDKFNASLDMVRGSNLEKAVDNKFATLTSVQRNGISYLMCNYLYLLRAFCHNDVFRDTILSICTDLRQKYDC